MSKAEKELTAEQIAFVDKCRKSAARCAELAAEANRLNMKKENRELRKTLDVTYLKWKELHEEFKD